MSSEHDPVIGQVGGFTWSSREAVAYEAAVEAANAVVGACSTRIAAEEARPEPDPEVVAELERIQSVAAREREQLDPADAIGIAAARARFSAQAAAVREGRA